MISCYFSHFRLLESPFIDNFQFRFYFFYFGLPYVVILFPAIYPLMYLLVLFSFCSLLSFMMASY